MANITWTFNQPTEKIILVDDNALYDENTDLTIDVRNSGVNYIVIPDLYLITDKDNQYPSGFQRLHYTEASASAAGNTLASTYYNGNWITPGLKQLYLVNSDGDITINSICVDDDMQTLYSNNTSTPYLLYDMNGSGTYPNIGENIWQSCSDRNKYNIIITGYYYYTKYGSYVPVDPIYLSYYDINWSTAACNYINTFFDAAKVPTQNFLNTLTGTYGLQTNNSFYIMLEDSFNNNLSCYYKVGIFNCLDTEEEQNILLSQSGVPYSIMNPTYKYNGSSDVIVVNKAGTNSVRSIIGNSRSDGNVTKNVITVF